MRTISKVYFVKIALLILLCLASVTASDTGAKRSEFLGIFTQTTGVRSLEVEYEEIKTILEHNPHIGGIVIRVRWSQLNPAEDTYSFGPLDRLIELISKHGKKIVLSVFPGAGTPGWVFAKGTPRFTEINMNKGFFQYGQEMNCPVPWDPHYMSAWEKMVAETARRYDGDPRIYAVGLFGHNYREVEMYMPAGDANMKRWVGEFGWSPQKVEQNWKHWIDFYGEKFRTLRFVLVLSDLYRDPGTNGVRDEIVRYAAEKYPSRVIAEHHGLHGNVDQRGNPNVRAMHAAGAGLIGGGVEFVASFYDNPASNRYTVGGIEMNILNAKYVPRLLIIHIWERDAANPEFSRMLLETHRQFEGMTPDELRAQLQREGLYVGRDATALPANLKRD